MKYDLEERTLSFSKKLLVFCESIAKDVISAELIQQVVRSSTSIGANYLEANDSLGRKDFIYRLKIARKEAKETIYWLTLISGVSSKTSDIDEFISECMEIKNILSAIIKNTTKPV